MADIIKQVVKESIPTVRPKYDDRENHKKFGGKTMPKIVIPQCSPNCWCKQEKLVKCSYSDSFCA